jgi:hypothetical protein
MEGNDINSCNNSTSKKSRVDNSTSSISLYQGLLKAANDSTTTNITFSPDFDGRDIRLFEVTHEFIDSLAAASAAGSGSSGNCELVLIGGDETDVVLCTGQSTYAVKRVETSNSCFLVPPVYDDVTRATGPLDYCIESTSKYYYETVIVNPKLDSIVETLSSTR